jgi:hypothetical protein
MSKTILQYKWENLIKTIWWLSVTYIAWGNHLGTLSYRQLVSMSCGMQLFHLALHPPWSNRPFAKHRKYIYCKPTYFKRRVEHHFSSKMKRKSRDWDLTLELSCHAGCPTVLCCLPCLSLGFLVGVTSILYHFSFYLYCVQTSNFATWSGLNFKTNVKVVLFKRENLIKTIWWLSVTYRLGLDFGALLSRWLSYCPCMIYTHFNIVV